MRDRTGRFITQQLFQIIHRLADHGGVPPLSCFDTTAFFTMLWRGFEMKYAYEVSERSERGRELRAQALRRLLSCSSVKKLCSVF